MFNFFKDLKSKDSKEIKDIIVDEKNILIASVLIECAREDGNFSEEENLHIKKLFEEKLKINEKDIKTLFAQAIDDSEQRVEIYSLIKEIRENSNIQITTKDKTDQEILELLNELILDFKEQGNLKKIESLEKELINNLDENSYLELIKLKSQLNRE